MSKRLFGRRGPVCPHCGGVERISKMQGKSTRVGLYKCYQCRKPFTVRMKTIFESSHIQLHLWLQAIHLLCSSKKVFRATNFIAPLAIHLRARGFSAIAFAKPCALATSRHLAVTAPP